MKIVSKYFDVKILIPVIAAIFSIPVFLTTNTFIKGVSVSELQIPLWLTFLSGLLSIFMVLLFIFSYIRKNVTTKKVVVISIIFFLIISNIVTTFLQPEIIVSHIYSFRLTYYVDVVTNIDGLAKLIFVIQYSILLLFLYSVLFIIPHMIKKIEIIKYLAYLVLIIFSIAILYSLINEGQKYLNFLKSIIDFKADPVALSDSSVNSFFAHKNIYALFLSFVTISLLYLFSESKKCIYIFLTIFSLIYLLFTYSKSFIILNYVFSIIFFYMYSVITFKNKKKVKIFLLSLFTFLLAALITTLIFLYHFNNDFKNMVEALNKGFGTFETRTLLWRNVVQIITPQWFFSGRGYGIVETILPEVTYISFVEKLVNEHSWFYSILAKGGIVLLSFFILFIFYTIILSIKAFKKNNILATPLIIGALLFFIQSFVENSYYSIFAFSALLKIVSNSNYIVMDYCKKKQDNCFLGVNMKIFINGKFLCQKITGVQRFAIETIKELDNLVPNNSDVSIICPNKEYLCNNINLKNIKIVFLKGKPNYFWEQILLSRFCKKNKPDYFLNLCNIAPVLYPGSCVVHDLGCIDAPKGFSYKQNVVYRLINKLNIKRYKYIFTVSYEMKKRIENYYKVKNVVVLYNSADHVKNIVAAKPNINLKNDFYFSLGSMNPNKNFKSIIRIAKKNKQDMFYISGKKGKSFNDEELDCPDNVVFCGYLTDQEIIYMYKHCKAFLFPSNYEGFGIPPLEALVSGCKIVICNDIPVLRELYEDSCYFVDFNRIDDLIVDTSNKKVFIDSKHWKDTALKLLKTINIE